MKQVIISIWLMAMVQVSMCYLAAYKNEDCSGEPEKEFRNIDCKPTEDVYTSFRIIVKEGPEVWHLYKDDSCSDKPNSTILNNRKECLVTSTITAVRKEK